jgi:AAA+ ATPase superfamily predicted ATPase
MKNKNIDLFVLQYKRNVGKLQTQLIYRAVVGDSGIYQYAACRKLARGARLSLYGYKKVQSRAHYLKEACVNKHGVHCHIVVGNWTVAYTVIEKCCANLETSHST